MLASYKIDPHGDDWQRTSTGTAAIVNAVNAVAMGLGGGDASSFVPIPDDFIVPYRERTDPEEEQMEASLNALEANRGI